jgi:hypothetical protein
MARFLPGSDVGWAVTDLQSINHVVAWLHLGPGPRPPAELTRSQQPGRPGWNGADNQMVKRAVDRFMRQMPMLFTGEPFSQGSADLLRAPTLRQALHDVLPRNSSSPASLASLGLGLLFCAIFWARNG